MTATPRSEILGVLSRADQRWADRHDLAPAETAYLEHLAAAVGAHVAGKRRHQDDALRTVLAAVLLDSFDPAGSLTEQTKEAIQVVGEVHAFLTELRLGLRKSA